MADDAEYGQWADRLNNDEACKQDRDRLDLFVAKPTSRKDVWLFLGVAFLGFSMPVIARIILPDSEPAGGAFPPELLLDSFAGFLFAVTLIYWLRYVAIEPLARENIRLRKEIGELKKAVDEKCES
ncbi:MAG: hypothetical protein JXR97_16795 [Planctomycetes bacterium]|nr:hypothetical protein [Planctomycetota bacterium]